MTLQRECCESEEDLARGITEAHVDLGKLDPDLFYQKKVSVNRLKITNLPQTIEIFQNNLPSKYMGHACFKVCEVIDNVKEFVCSKRITPPHNVWVEAAPEHVALKPGHIPNPGHAEIMPSMTRGMSNNFVKFLQKNNRCCIISS